MYLIFRQLDDPHCSQPQTYAPCSMPMITSCLGAAGNASVGVSVASRLLQPSPSPRLRTLLPLLVTHLRPKIHAHRRVKNPPRRQIPLHPFNRRLPSTLSNHRKRLRKSPRLARSPPLRISRRILGFLRRLCAWLLVLTPSARHACPPTTNPGAPRPLPFPFPPVRHRLRRSVLKPRCFFLAFSTKRPSRINPFSPRYLSCLAAQGLVRALRQLRTHQVKYPRTCKPSPRCTIGSSVFELRLSILVSCRRPSSSLFRRGPWLLAILVLYSLLSSTRHSSRTPRWLC